MSMIDHSKTTIETKEELHAIAQNLLKTLPKKNGIRILLSGELGAGKTTFVQAMGKLMDIREPITSPSYALLQEYGQNNVDAPELTHIDLYRLKNHHVEPILEQINPLSHIILIEWPEQSEAPIQHDIHITITPQPDEKTRVIDVSFSDALIPSDAQIREWQKELRLPQHIIAHCDTVAMVAMRLAEHCEAHGMIVRKKAVRAAALLHDLFRFVDFTENGNPEKNAEQSEEDRTLWSRITGGYPPPHECAIEQWLQEKGCALLAQITRSHRGDEALTLPYSIEERIVAYADKRVMGETIVSIDERFADLSLRYRNGEETAASNAWKESIKWIEKTLNIENDTIVF